MRIITSVSILLLFASHLSAQTIEQTSMPDNRDWVEMIKDGDVDYHTLVQMHDEYWADKEITKGCGWKPFKRWEATMRERVGEDGSLPKGRDIFSKYEDALSFSNQRSPSGNWQTLGPVLDGNTTREDIRGVGRTTTLAFHPTDENTIFIGTPAGGIWRTYDAGESWVSNTDDLPTMGVSAIAFNPDNPSIVYAGTGDRDGGDAPGMGVMKSVDSGLTWALINAGIENLSVGSLLVNPEDPNIILAGTNNGIYRSIDAGDSWTYVSSTSADYRSMLFKPDDSNVVYATGSGKVFKSIDAGENWYWLNQGIQSPSRMVIGVSPANPEILYALGATTYQFYKFYRSTDAGENFEEMSDSPNILGWAADGSSDGGQAWYDLCMTVDAQDEETIYVGGIRMKKSIDGGITWMDINSGYLHVDQHECAISPHNNDLYLANDGGFYHYENNEEWVDISNNIINGQIYRMGQSPHNGARALTGFQDNGTSEFLGTSWIRRGGGDGFECWYDHSDPEWRYSSLYYGGIYRTGQNFTNQKICGEGVLGINEEGAWLTPYVLSYDDPNVMFAGLKNVWRTKNIKTAVKDSIVWEKISNNLGGNNDSNLDHLKIHNADPNIVYCSEGIRKLFRSNNALDSVPEWTTLSASLPFFGSPVTAIETHPSDTNIIYIGFDEKVWKSENQGGSWEDISGSIPNVNVNTIVYDFTSDEGLYVGTDMGIYYKDATMEDWLLFSGGFPLTVSVRELEIYYGESLVDSRIRAATYGRGLWESDLYGATTSFLPPVAALENQTGDVEVFGEFDVDIKFYRANVLAEVTDFTVDDIYVENAIVNDLTDNGIDFSLNLTAQNFGVIKIFVEPEAALDLYSVASIESDTLQLYYVEPPEEFGIYGPGGVGDETTIPLWLKADHGVSQGGTAVENDGDKIDSWESLMGAGVAIQENIDYQPTLLLDDNGINDMPVVYFNGDNQYLLAEDIVPGANLSVCTVVEADEIQFNQHGWMASSRGNNGFVIHPWKEESQYSAVIIDNEDEYASGSKHYIGDAAAPHIYGVVYERTDWFQIHQTLFDDQKIVWNGANIGERDGNAEIDIQFGWDYDDRFGQGKIAEHFIFNRRMYETHRTIVANYMAGKYGIDLGLLNRYSHPDKNYEIAGIGQEQEHDYHNDAQGTGIVRMNEPTNLDNGEYLIWGHDNDDMAWNEDGFPITSLRLDRTWAFEKTGDLGEVLVQIYEEDILGQQSNIGLIIADTDEFNPGQDLAFVPLSESGGVYSATVDFPSSGVFTIGVSPTVGIPELNESLVSIHPNPSDGTFNVSIAGFEDKEIDVRVLSVTGDLVIDEQHIGNFELEMENLPAGLYLLELRSGFESNSQKILKY